MTEPNLRSKLLVGQQTIATKLKFGQLVALKPWPKIRDFVADVMQRF